MNVPEASHSSSQTPTAKEPAARAVLSPDGRLAGIQQVPLVRVVILPDFWNQRTNWVEMRGLGFPQIMMCVSSSVQP